MEGGGVHRENILVSYLYLTAQQGFKNKLMNSIYLWNRVSCRGSEKRGVTGCLSPPGTPEDAELPGILHTLLHELSQSAPRLGSFQLKEVCLHSSRARTASSRGRALPASGETAALSFSGRTVLQPHCGKSLARPGLRKIWCREHFRHPCGSTVTVHSYRISLIPKHTEHHPMCLVVRQTKMSTQT